MDIISTIKSNQKASALALIVIAVAGTLLAIYLSRKEKFTYEGALDNEEGKKYKKEMEDDNNYVSPSEDHQDKEKVNYEPENKDLADQEKELLAKSQELTTKNLLPSGDNDEYSLLSKNFLVNNFDIGTESRGTALQVPNLQLRSDPLVPKMEGLTPFNNSTATQDTLRKTFEIGQ
jgi:hypothetical protein